MLQVVVIDDLKVIPELSLRFTNGEVIYLRTLDEAWIWILRSPEDESLNELWLDHDLGGDDTIRPLVLWLADRAFHGNPYPVKKIVICSMNPVGVKWIESTLNRYYHVEKYIGQPGANHQ
jgi:hypothetical protein